MPNNPSPQSYQKTIDALPLIERSEEMPLIVDSEQSFDIWRRLRQEHSVLPGHIFLQVDLALHEATRQLGEPDKEGNYSLSEDRIKAMLSLIAIRSMAQSLVDIGEVLDRSQQLNILLYEDTSDGT